MKYLEVKMGDAAEGPAPLRGLLRWGGWKPYGGYPRMLMDMVKEDKYPFRTKHENPRKLMDAVKEGKHPFRAMHEVDLRMSLAFDQQFLDNESLHVGRKIFAIWVDQNPEYRKYGQR